MTKVFLSHNSKEKSQVRILSELLEKEEHIDTIFDDHDFRGGDILLDKIEKCIKESDVCLIIIGKEGFGRYHKMEMDMAIRLQLDDPGSLQVIPVVLPGVGAKAAEILPEYLQRYLWIEFQESINEERPIQKLKNAITGESKEIPSFAPDHCPYKGLRFFDVEDSPNFFGRESVVQRLSDELTLKKASKSRNQFLAILGNSGSGKSSLARAGILAQLKNATSSDGQVCKQVICYPGQKPIENLAISLSHSKIIGNTLEEVRSFEREIQHNDRTLYLKGQIRAKKRGELVPIILLIDQFEELFTLCESEAEQKAFIDNLCVAATENNSNWIILITLPTQFLGKFHSYECLNTLISKHNYIITDMGEEELKSAILRPAQSYGYTFEEGLVKLLINETQGKAGRLPLLQDTLEQLWKHRKGNRFTHEAYNKLGGIGGALNQKADQFYEGLTQEEQEQCKHIFLELVKTGERMEVTKRRVVKDDFANKNIEEAPIKLLLDKLKGSETRLVVEDNEYLEISHEALIQNWAKLKDWIEENRKNIEFRGNLANDVEKWEERDRHQDYLYTGLKYAELENWVKNHPNSLKGPQEEFLNRSRKKRRGKIISHFLLRPLSILTLSIFLVAMVGIGTVYLKFSEALKWVDNHSDKKIYNLSASSKFVPNRHRNTHSAFLKRIKDRNRNSPILEANMVAFDNEGKLVLTWGKDSTLHIWNADSSENLFVVQGHRGKVQGAVLSQNRSKFLTWGEDSLIFVWNLKRSRDSLALIFPQYLNVGSGRINTAGFCKDATRVLSWDESGSIRIWDLEYNEWLSYLHPENKENPRIVRWISENFLKEWFNSRFKKKE